MKYHNDGVLRNEQDSTLWIRPGTQKKKLTWMEYLPLVVLGILMAGMLIKSIIG